MTQIFINQEYEYDYQEVDGVHTLYRNNSEQWIASVKGEVVMKITDDRNGLIFGEKLKKRIDYSESIYLTILLKLINKDYKFEISNKVMF